MGSEAARRFEQQVAGGNHYFRLVQEWNADEGGGGREDPSSPRWRPYTTSFPGPMSYPLDNFGLHTVWPMFF